MPANLKYLFFAIPFLLVFQSCINTPDFPLEPKIKFNSLSFIKTNANEILRLKIDFTDGDGDLGLSGLDTLYPYNPENDIYGNYTNENYKNIFIKFEIKSEEKDYRECNELKDCSEVTVPSKYQIVINDKKKDTTINQPLYRILQLQYNGRFPLLGPDNKKRPISGTLTYDLTSLAFPPYFKNKTIRLKVKIKDRSLNTSNEIITDTLRVK